MESIARFMVATTELLEAEAKVVKRQAVRIAIAAGLGIVALAMTLAGFGFIAYGAVAYLARVVGGPGAALIFGAIAIAMAVAALVYGRKLIK